MEAKEKSVLMSFIFPASLVEKLNNLAIDKNVSLNEYVLDLLQEATKDSETSKEREIRLKKTNDFLSEFSGSWVGDESIEDIIKEISSGRVERPIIEL